MATSVRDSLLANRSRKLIGNNATSVYGQMVNSGLISSMLPAQSEALNTIRCDAQSPNRCRGRFGSRSQYFQGRIEAPLY
jgi:hypothetical protein